MASLPKIAVLFSNFGPYHLARLEATAKKGVELGYEVMGLEIAGSLQRYPWIAAGEAKKRLHTVFPDSTLEEVAAADICRRTWQALSRVQPDVVAICGYSDPAMLTALAWAAVRRKKRIFMLESKANDQPRQAWKEMLKRRLVRRFDAALVGGTAAREYAIALGLPAERVFVGYDVVDNGHFALGAEAARQHEAALRRTLGLPRPFFLNVSRFIAKKNLCRLVEAYRRYRQMVGREPWDLVLCGSGPLEAKLKAAAADLPGVHFPGFQQAEELPVYYGLAQVFIIPSSHYEQWGLVVNEAMASGLPVLVSKACGCAPDLVQEGVNGFTFDPYDVEGLARLMVKMSSGEVDLQAMGEASRKIIAHWTPEVFAANLFRAIEAARSKS
jgi:1,2-diacylglycerol 3-alpha-glucosyltransferase